MLTYLRTGKIDDVARSIPEPLLQEARRVAIADEADVVAVGLVRNRETSLSRLGTYLGLQR